MQNLPNIVDTCPWFIDAVSLEIGKAGISCFSGLGFFDADESPLTPPTHAKRLVYSLLPEGRFINDLDRFYMGSIVRGALLKSLSFGEAGDGIDIFAVELDCGTTRRTEDGYGVHFLLSKLTDNPTIVMFRNDDSIMLSTQVRVDERKSSFILSDWFSPYEEDLGNISQFHVAGCRLDSVDLFLEDFAYLTGREIYRSPVLTPKARYMLFCDAVRGMTSAEPPYATRADLYEAISDQYDEELRRIGDEYVEVVVESYEDDLLDMDELEWMLGEDESPEVREANEEEVEEDDRWSSMTSAVPKDVLDDPIELLRWMGSR